MTRPVEDAGVQGFRGSGKFAICFKKRGKAFSTVAGHPDPAGSQVACRRPEQRCGFCTFVVSCRWRVALGS